MSIPDLTTGLRLIESAGVAALAAEGPEAAMQAIAAHLYPALGHRGAPDQPGALQSGERQFFVVGTFIVTPDRQWHMLVGNVNFPPEQQRLMVPIDGGHLGWVYAHRAPLLLKNTDEHGAFRQYLKTARMGSALYAPLVWRGECLGQLLMAAQARNTMDEGDLAVLGACAPLAAAAWVAQSGPAWLARAYPPPNACWMMPQGLST
jgi:hypothetical protein